MAQEDKDPVNDNDSLFCLRSVYLSRYIDVIRDHAQISATKLDVYWLGNLSVSVPRNGERTWPGSLAQGIHDQSS